MIRQALFVLSWFVAGGLTFYAVLLQNDNASLEAELNSLRGYRLRFEEQQQLNTRQREEFETRAQQLENNLESARAQMTNLSQALQEAREMMEPAARQAIERISSNAGGAAQ